MTGNDTITITKVKSSKSEWIEYNHWTKTDRNKSNTTIPANQCIILKIDGFQNKLAVKKWQNSVHMTPYVKKHFFSFNLQAWNYVSVYGLLDGLPHYRYVLPLSCTYMQKVQGLFHKGQADYLVGLLPPLIYVEQVKQHSVI